jgi:hypothetical protein
MHLIQMTYLASTMEKQAHELVTMRAELVKTADNLCESEQRANLAKHESKINGDISLSQQDQLRHAKTQNEQLNQNLSEIREKLADSQISQHKLQTMNDSLRAGE